MLIHKLVCIQTCLLHGTTSTNVVCWEKSACFKFCHVVLLYEHALNYRGKECGVYFDDANPKYLTSNYRQAGSGLTYHYVECLCKNDKETLMLKRLQNYGASKPEILTTSEGNINVW